MCTKSNGYLCAGICEAFAGAPQFISRQAASWQTCLEMGATTVHNPVNQHSVDQTRCLKARERAHFSVGRLCFVSEHFETSRRYLKAMVPVSCLRSCCVSDHMPVAWLPAFPNLHQASVLKADVDAMNIHLLCYEKQTPHGTHCDVDRFSDNLSEAAHVQGQLRSAQWRIFAEKQVS